MKRLIGTVTIVLSTFTFLSQECIAQKSFAKEYEKISDGYSVGHNIHVFKDGDDVFFQVVQAYEDDAGNLQTGPVAGTRINLATSAVQVWLGKKDQLHVQEWGKENGFNPTFFSIGDTSIMEMTITPTFDAKVFPELPPTKDAVFIGIEDAREYNGNPPAANGTHPDDWQKPGGAVSLDYLSLNRKRLRIWYNTIRRTLFVTANVETKAKPIPIDPCQLPKMKWGEFDPRNTFDRWCTNY